MELQIGDSQLHYDTTNCQVHIAGSMRLPNMQEYDAITQFLKSAAAQCKEHLTIDLSKLNFLNSSGITTLSLFIIHASKTGKPQIKVVGSQDIPWHTKSLSNFKKLWKEVALEIK
ncbi:MAG: hypothetical protein LAT76_05595 [Schleiferiaceae bacterium]|nr:hypothetical protein [Schleiferiaceae bacterium]